MQYFAPKLKFIFLAQLITTLNSYSYSMSPMARLNLSAFLGVDLQPCKTMTDTSAPMECANWEYPAWNSTLDRNGVSLA